MDLLKANKPKGNNEVDTAAIDSALQELKATMQQPNLPKVKGKFGNVCGAAKKLFDSTSAKVNEGKAKDTEDKEAKFSSVVAALAKVAGGKLDATWFSGWVVVCSCLYIVGGVGCWWGWCWWGWLSFGLVGGGVGCIHCP